MNYVNNNSIINPNREDIINFKKYLGEYCKTNTIALYLAALRRFFQWTEQKGLYPNIAVGIKAPRIDKGHKKDYLAAEQVKGILHNMSCDSLEGLRNYAIMALMTTGGLRTIEIVRANVEDIRIVGGVTVLYIQGKGKTDKTDFIKLAPQVTQAIADYLTKRGQVKGSDPLFVSCSRRNKGQRLTTRTISYVCKNALRQNGFNSIRLTAHSLRHTAVTLALLAGLSLAEVQLFARHRNIATTQIYAHNIDRMKSQCENVIASAIF